MLSSYEVWYRTRLLFRVSVCIYVIQVQMAVAIARSWDWVLQTNMVFPLLVITRECALTHTELGQDLLEALQYTALAWIHQVPSASRDATMIMMSLSEVKSRRKKMEDLNIFERQLKNVACQWPLPMLPAPLDYNFGSLHEHNCLATALISW